jgi:hypothetical protein
MHDYFLFFDFFFVDCDIRKQRIIEMRKLLMNKYNVSYEEVIDLYISDLRQWLGESLMESRGFPPAVVSKTSGFKKSYKSLKTAAVLRPGLTNFFTVIR